MSWEKCVNGAVPTTYFIHQFHFSFFFTKRWLQPFIEMFFCKSWVNKATLTKTLSLSHNFWWPLDLDFAVSRPSVSIIFMQISIRCSFVYEVSSTSTQKMKFSINDFFSTCDQIRRKLRIWSHLATEEILNGKLHFLWSVPAGMFRQLCDKGEDCIL